MYYAVAFILWLLSQFDHMCCFKVIIIDQLRYFWVFGACSIAFEKFVQDRFYVYGLDVFPSLWLDHSDQIVVNANLFSILKKTKLAAVQCGDLDVVFLELR